MSALFALILGEASPRVWAVGEFLSVETPLTPTLFPQAGRGNSTAATTSITWPASAGREGLRYVTPPSAHLSRRARIP